MKTNPTSSDNYTDYKSELLKKALRPQRQPEPIDAAEEWLDSFDIQALFKISVSTLYRMRKANQIPYTRLKGKCVYPKNFFYNSLLKKAIETMR